MRPGRRPGPWLRRAIRALPLVAVALGAGCAAPGPTAADSAGRLLTPAGEVVVKGDAIPTPVTVEPGNVERGRQVFLDRERGHCLLCHALPGLDAPFPGDIGTDLTGVAQRLSPGQLRLRLVDASRLNPATIMPPYFRTNDLVDVQPAYRGRPVLTAQEVEDLIAFLVTQGWADD